MLTCKDMTDLLSDSLETQLPWPKRWAMRFHLGICKTCRRYRQHLLFMQKALVKLDTHSTTIALPDAAKARIKANLQKQSNE